MFRDSQSKLIDGLMNEFRRFREKEDVSWEAIHKVIGTFVKIGFKDKVGFKKIGENFEWTGDKDLKEYEEYFEKRFINATRTYYTAKANDWVEEYNCPEYVTIVSRTIEVEEKIADQHMESTTKDLLVTVLNTILIEENAQVVIGKEETGVKDMLNNKKFEELKELFWLYSRVESTFKYIILEMEPFIEFKGTAIVEDQEILKDPIKFTTKLLDLKREMDEIVITWFNNHIAFNQARDRSFLKFMNKFSDTPQYLAEYWDNLFRVGIKGMSESEIDENLNAIIRLFRCLHNRDIFAKAYEKYQALRLLNKSSLNSNAEQSMISKLKIEWGFNTIQKLTRMFTDMDLSKTAMVEFAKKKGAEIKGVEINVDVLTSGIWPEQIIHPLKLPSELNEWRK